MKYHLRLSKGLSYCGVLSATKQRPDAYTDSKAVADQAVASGYFTLVEENAGKKLDSRTKRGKVKPESESGAETEDGAEDEIDLEQA